MKSTRVRIFYPADPVGVVPGGIDTFLRGLIKFAPVDIDFSLVGMTTDVRQRPLRRWTKCSVGEREFDFFPVVSVADSGSRGRVPLSARFSVALWRQQAALRTEFDLFDFHRVEPSLLFTADSRPKNFYFHQDPKILRLAASDNLWKRLPAAYESIERRAMATMSSTWCVRDSGVQTLRERYPAKVAQINFIPTWVDAQVFHPVAEDARSALRERLAHAHGIDGGAQWLVSVGRLDTQKDPALMFAAFARLCAQGRQVAWLVVGDGVLRADLQRLVQGAGLGAKVHFLGLRPPAEIADVLRAADVYALSSAYEGMPMALLEGLGSGLPAAVTDVGEVRRVVKTGINGVVSQDRSEETFAAALAEVLDHASAWRGEAALASVAPFQPAAVLAPAYDNYRELARPFVDRRLSAWAARADDSPGRHRHAVVGVPIDLLDRQEVSRQLVSWGKAHESRYMCFANVHSAVLASQDERHRLALLGADMVAPDGAPIAWSLRVKGHRQQQRVDGPGMMWALCDAARTHGVKVGLYGSTDATLDALKAELEQAFPGLEIVYAYSPPFRELSEQEDQAVCDAIGDAGVELLFVGLGCPKQEDWMARHRGRVPAVMLGVGAAFEFHAGTVSRAPHWMREHGLEWAYRLGSQPGRLWRRYLFTNSIFLARSASEAARSATGRTRRNRPDVHNENHYAKKTMTSTMTKKAAPDKRAIEDLLTRIDSSLPGPGGRIVGFIASGPGEGTSTLARAFVVTAATQLRRRSLLLTLDLAGGAGEGVLQALAAGKPLAPLCRPLVEGGAAAALGSPDGAGALWELLPKKELWDQLRQQYDDIVLDLPTPELARIGLPLAAQCDGVVVVVEAEKTRAPVAESLIASLRLVRARILGTVLNKRRFYLPARVYRWL